MAGWSGRIWSHLAIASPITRSTGLVKAVPVLFVGTSSRQTASFGRTSPVPRIGTASCCQRIQPTRRRLISLTRSPAKSQTTIGQVPDVLEDVWIDVALGDIERAKKVIAAVPKKHPFDIKYQRIEKVDWETCEQVLSDRAKRAALTRGW